MSVGGRGLGHYTVAISNDIFVSVLLFGAQLGGGSACVLLIEGPFEGPARIPTT